MGNTRDTGPHRPSAPAGLCRGPLALSRPTVVAAANIRLGGCHIETQGSAASSRNPDSVGCLLLLSRYWSQLLAN